MIYSCQVWHSTNIVRQPCKWIFFSTLRVCLSVIAFVKWLQVFWLMHLTQCSLFIVQRLHRAYSQDTPPLMKVVVASTRFFNLRDNPILIGWTANCRLASFLCILYTNYALDVFHCHQQYHLIVLNIRWINLRPKKKKKWVDNSFQPDFYFVLGCLPMDLSHTDKLGAFKWIKLWWNALSVACLRLHI